jgi:hypothetical protein
MKFTATEYGKKRILSDEFAEATLAMARSMYPKGYSEMDLLAIRLNWIWKVKSFITSLSRKKIC